VPFHELSAHNCIDTTSLKKFLQIYERYKNKILSQERLKKHAITWSGGGR
jgi:hypothetical protein